MARCNVLYYCTQCRRIHPMGISLPLEASFLKMKIISDAYSGKPLPLSVAVAGG